MADGQETQTENQQGGVPQDLQDELQNYSIPEKFLKERPDLIELILRSKSIETHDEKQNWFNLLPLMNEEQVKKLTDILLKEKRKLQEIEEKYSKKKSNIKEKYKKKRTEEGYINSMNELEEKEEKSQKQDEQEAEELLDEL